MTRLAAWLAKNTDAALALFLAIVVGVLGLLPGVGDEVVGSATLLVLGLLATSILRDRWRSGPVEAEVRDSLRDTEHVLAALPGRLDRLQGLDRLEETVAQTRRALQESSTVRVLTGAEVGQALAEARRATDRWIFKGGTGTYIRAVTLPECVEYARRDKRTLLVRLEIIDPTNEGVCDTYARFRKQVSNQPDGTGELWTFERTRKESFATILAACWYRRRIGGLLDIDIGLSSTMTTIRWDMSSQYVIITQEDPRAPAMMVDRGKFYYDWCSTELQHSLDQARRVPIEQARDAPLSDEPTVEETRKLFEVLGLPLPRSFTDRDVVEIIRKALRAKNPYD